MTVAENGNQKGLTPADIGHAVGRGINWVRENPRISLAYGAFGTLIFASATVPKIIYTIRQPAMEAEKQARIAAEATATQTAIDLVTRDYEQTRGVDIVRQKESYAVTLRESARLAPSEAALIDNAWARVRSDSGCQPTETIILPAVPSPQIWDAPKAPKTYVIRIHCPIP